MDDSPTSLKFNGLLKYQKKKLNFDIFLINLFRKDIDGYECFVGQTNSQVENFN